MKKSTILTVLVVLMTILSVLGCASKEAAPAADAAPKAIPSGPVTLVEGKDWDVEPVFGIDLFTYDAGSFYFNLGARNSNHAALFRLLDPSILYENSVIEISYKMDVYDSSKACQLVIQPASEDGADFGSQNYPILFDNFDPEAPKVLTIDCNKLLKSSVGKELVGFRIVNNEGSYDKWTWQGKWGFTIESVVLKAAEAE